MKTLLKKKDPWADGEDRYVGVVAMVHTDGNPRLKGKAGEAVYHVLNADWEPIPNLTYSTIWHEWAKMLCEDELEEETRVAYFAFTVTQNKAKGTERVVKAAYHGPCELGKKLIDNGQELWDGLPDHFDGFSDKLVINVNELPLSTPKKKARPIPRKRVKKPLRKAKA